jgi:hypothetical protein
VTIKIAAKVVEEVSQSNKNSDTRKEGVKYTQIRLGGSLKKKWEKKSNAWSVHWNYTQTVYW